MEILANLGGLGKSVFPLGTIRLAGREAQGRLAVASYPCRWQYDLSGPVSRSALQPSPHWEEL